MPSRRSARTATLALAVGAAAWSAGCSSNGSPAHPATSTAPATASSTAAPTRAASAGRPFTVRSTLDGRTSLPRRIRWLARPDLAASEVEHVDFLVDGGRPRWTEKSAPYTFVDDEDGAHRGYLVTTWLAPGRHRFTVRVTASDGRTSTDTVIASVRRAPDPPDGLKGTWRRTIADTSTAPKPGSAGNPTETLTPAGTYTMVVDRRWVQMRFPGRFRTPQSDDTGEGWILDSDYSAGARVLRAVGAVTFDTHHGQAELGWWCWPDGPPQAYGWSVRGSTLTLRPQGGRDACGVRGFVWTGRWRRVG